MGSEIANSIFPVYPTVSLCDSYHQMCFQREEDFFKRLVRGRENGEEGEGEDSPPPQMCWKIQWIMDGGDVVIKTLSIISLSLSVNAQYMCILLLSGRYIGGAKCSHFKDAERRWQRKWWETDGSVMSSPYWRSTANNNAMKRWAEVKNIPNSPLPPSCNPCLSSHWLYKYPINY